MKTGGFVCEDGNYPLLEKKLKIKQKNNTFGDEEINSPLEYIVNMALEGTWAG